MTPYKKVKRYSVFVIARIFLSFLSLFPLDLALSIGSLVGSIVNYVALRPRRIALRQLQESMSYSESEAVTVVHRLFRNCGRLAVEMACLTKIYKQIQSSEIKDPNLIVNQEKPKKKTKKELAMEKSMEKINIINNIIFNKI